MDPNAAAHRDDEDGPEAAAAPGPLEQVPRRVPGRPLQTRCGLAGRRAEPPQQWLVPAAGARRGADDAVEEAAQHPGERVLVNNHGAGAGGGVAVGGPVHVSRGGGVWSQWGVGQAG
jgi:hypothetical protein